MPKHNTPIRHAGDIDGNPDMGQILERLSALAQAEIIMPCFDQKIDH
jgi:hypothetical protein